MLQTSQFNQNTSTLNKSSLSASRLDISTYTNYIVYNSVRENIELKNQVKTKGLLFSKNRYAILTTFRYLIFETKEKYLNKKKPSKHFVLADYDFDVHSNILVIIKDEKVVKEYIYPSAEIAIHWWETIHQIKTTPMQYDEAYENTLAQNTNFNKSNIFTKSVIEDLNESAFFKPEDKSDNNPEDKTDSNAPTNEGLNLAQEEKIPSFNFLDTNAEKPKKKVAFKTNLEKKYLVHKQTNIIQELKHKRNSEGQIDKNDSFISKISQKDEGTSSDDFSDIDIPKSDDESQTSRKDISINRISGIKTKRGLRASRNPSPETMRANLAGTRRSSNCAVEDQKNKLFEGLKQQEETGFSINPVLVSHSSFDSVSNERSPSDTFKLNPIHNFSSKINIRRPPNVRYIFSLESVPDVKHKSDGKKESYLNHRDENKESLDLKENLNDNCTNDYQSVHRRERVIMDTDKDITNIITQKDDDSMKEEKTFKAPKLKFTDLLEKNSGIQNEQTQIKSSLSCSKSSRLGSTARITRHPALSRNRGLDLNSYANKKTEEEGGKNEKENNIFLRDNVYIGDVDEMYFSSIDKSYDESKVIPNTTSKKDYYFIEKKYKDPQEPSRTSRQKVEKMKPSTLIEQLLENRYTKTMLRVSLKEKTKTSTFIPKLQESLNAIMLTQKSDVVLSVLYEKMPGLYRKRLNQRDLNILSGTHQTFRYDEMKKLITNDIDALLEIFESFYAKLYKETKSKFELVEKKAKFITEMKKIKFELNNVCN